MNARATDSMLPALTLWCALCFLTPHTALAMSLESLESELSSTLSKGQEIWMTTPPPAKGTVVEFPSNAIFYERVNNSLPPKSFFNTHWYISIIILLLGVIIAYALLALWMCYRFEYQEQRNAKRVVAQAYVTDGFFPLGSSTTRLPAQQHRCSSSSSDCSTTPGSNGNVCVGVNPLGP
ncbi:hypothetical protein, unknown function [Leishmania tarentolae]|uniref:Uncharacterized protein n=1 Tax=Leishmania tarentolae TaxID=5689 RepID=A0A640KFC1_LEITA|nr:hypothetical protein, unknown function [Leishmania tarentolae]